MNMKKDRKPRKIKKSNKKVSYNPSNTGSRKNLVLVSGAALAVIAIAAIVFITLTSLFSTESYYVLNTNVKSKQQITPEMVVARETAEGTGPVHALSMEEIQRGGVYSKYPLFAGDVIAHSNAGPLSGTPLGIPDDWSVTSFNINSTDAVGGILGKGDYADILGINLSDGESGAQYIFNNVLILEVKFLNEEFDGALDGQTVVGETMHYTVGLPAEDVAYLHHALAEFEEVKMIKSPIEINYQDRDVSKLKKLFKYNIDIGNIDVIEGTDPTFTEIERDKNGRPINHTSKSKQSNEATDKDLKDEDAENENLIEVENNEEIEDNEDLDEEQNEEPVINN